MFKSDSEGLCVFSALSLGGSKISQMCESRCHQLGYLPQLFYPLLHHHYPACFSQKGGRSSSQSLFMWAKPHMSCISSWFYLASLSLITAVDLLLSLADKCWGKWHFTIYDLRTMDDWDLLYPCSAEEDCCGRLATI